MKNRLQNSPIGVFDSGVGGLTVVKELLKILPSENIIYFGDTARVPYGTKSKESVIKFSKEIADFLIQKHIKMLLVACNTASSVALDVLRKKIKIPVIGVIDSGVSAAVSFTKKNKIGVIGTEATIKSGAYKKQIKRISPNCKVVNRACPLFVPLVEEGWINKKITIEIAQEYLYPLRTFGVDTVILGCTHYPLIKEVIQKVLGNKITLVDSASTVSLKVKQILKNQKILNTDKKHGYLKFFVSDAPEKFKKLGKLFLNKKIVSVSKIDVG
ncbi:MAG: glutamate racemase [Elusimicrobiota bacterium]